MNFLLPVNEEDRMTTATEKSIVPPSQTTGGNAPDADEIARKGAWAGQGIVPTELGGTDAPREMLTPDPGLGSSALAQTTGSDESATGADSTTSGGANLPNGEGIVEPSLRDVKKADAAMNPAQAVHDYEATKRA